jgi:hypothetical protein
MHWAQWFTPLQKVTNFNDDFSNVTTRKQRALPHERSASPSPRVPRPAAQALHGCYS